MKISAGIARRVGPSATSDTCIYVFIHQETVTTQKTQQCKHKCKQNESNDQVRHK